MPALKDEMVAKAKEMPAAVTAPAERPTMVINGEARIPGWVVDLASFRRWACSDAFPRHGRFSYLGGELWVDLSMEELFNHNLVKTEFTAVLAVLIRAQRLGYFFSDRALLSNPDADLSTEPDGIFVSTDALRTNRVRLVEGVEERYVELEGSPEMVLEIVSPSSIHKDTVRLRERYWRAGVAEYWLVDARGSQVRFDILHRGSKRFIATRRQGGWLRSSVFRKSFQLTRETDALGHPAHTLLVQS